VLRHKVPQLGDHSTCNTLSENILATEPSAVHGSFCEIHTLDQLNFFGARFNINQ
jgi:hypothetical protein